MHNASFFVSWTRNDFYYIVFSLLSWFAGHPASSFAVEFVKFLCNAGLNIEIGLSKCSMIVKFVILHDLNQITCARLLVMVMARNKTWKYVTFSIWHCDVCCSFSAWKCSPVCFAFRICYVCCVHGYVYFCSNVFVSLYWSNPTCWQPMRYKTWIIVPAISRIPQHCLKKVVFEQYVSWVPGFLFGHCKTTAK